MFSLTMESKSNVLSLFLTHVQSGFGTSRKQTLQPPGLAAFVASAAAVQAGRTIAQTVSGVPPAGAGSFFTATNFPSCPGSCTPRRCGRQRSRGSTARADTNSPYCTQPRLGVAGAHRRIWRLGLLQASSPSGLPPTPPRVINQSRKGSWPPPTTSGCGPQPDERGLTTSLAPHRGGTSECPAAGDAVIIRHLGPRQHHGVRPSLRSLRRTLQPTKLTKALPLCRPRRGGTDFGRQGITHLFSHSIHLELS